MSNSTKKTIALFGAGPGLAPRSPRASEASYRIALVARNAASLAERVAEPKARASRPPHARPTLRTSQAFPRSWHLHFHIERREQGRGCLRRSATITALIERSAGHRAMTANVQPLNVPMISSEKIADKMRSLVTKRDRVEAVVPAPLAK